MAELKLGATNLTDLPADISICPFYRSTGRRHGAAMGITLKAIDNDLTVQVMNVDTDNCSAQILTGEELAEEGTRMEEVR
jgi:hypothetical protein